MSDRVKSKLYSTVRWQKLRRLAFARSYYCMYCYKNQSNQIDHLSGCTSDNVIENLIPSCHACHSRKTQRIDCVCRLINITNFADALHFVAMKSKHSFDIPDRVVEELDDNAKLVYNMLKRYSLYREVTELPEGSNVSVYTIRYVVALVEVHRISITS
jgi:hypothetical protein